MGHVRFPSDVNGRKGGAVRWVSSIWEGMDPRHVRFTRVFDFSRDFASFASFSFDSFVLSFESFRPRPILHHLSFSSVLTLSIGSLGVTDGTFVTSPNVPQFIPSSPALDFFFFTTRISPNSGSSVGSTYISNPPLVDAEPPTRRTTSERSLALSLSLSLLPTPSKLNLDFFGTRRLRGADTSTRGPSGDGTEAHELLEMSATEVLASDEMPVAEGVAVMRRMLGMGFETAAGWGGVAVAGRDNSSVLRIFFVSKTYIGSCVQSRR